MCFKHVVTGFTDATQCRAMALLPYGGRYDGAALLRLQASLVASIGPRSLFHRTCPPLPATA